MLDGFIIEELRRREREKREREGRRPRLEIPRPEPPEARRDRPEDDEEDSSNVSSSIWSSRLPIIRKLPSESTLPRAWPVAMTSSARSPHLSVRPRRLKCRGQRRRLRRRVTERSLERPSE